ncbi:hypothetical protein [Streptomyces cyaneus]|uniref:hypothetical protein n=1 Tax=Streptomyces cyaneus TaxID=1904 RepID=UPI000FF87DFA|nr:hypothetical protein [Streptomyces cyaneus]
MTRMNLGEHTLSALRVQLRAVDCQTCGRPFLRWQRPALAVYTDGEYADASLHHVGCHRPGWHEGWIEPVLDRQHLSWRAGTFVLPARLMLGLSSDDIPFFLVNPAFEAALLHHRDGRGWQVWTVQFFKELGLDLRGSTALSSAGPTPTLAASIEDHRISVTVRSGEAHHHWPNIPIFPETARLVRARGSIVVGVTTRLDVCQRLSHPEIAAGATSGSMAVGVAALAPKGKGRRRRKH